MLDIPNSCVKYPYSSFLQHLDSFYRTNTFEPQRREMSMGCVSSYHPGGEQAPVFALQWKLPAVEVPCSTLVLRIYSADDLYISGLAGNVFQDRSINR